MERGELCRKHWEQHIARWRQSGMKVAQWCKENNVSQTQLWYWRKILSPVSPAPQQQSSQKSSFSELVDSQDNLAGIDILVNGKALRLYKNFDETTFKQCLRLLGG